MKKITLTLVAVLSAILLLAQSPQAFKYQTVVRDNTGEILVDQAVRFRNSIRKDSINGDWVYIETHLDTTNQFGLVTLEIGNGTATSGVFEDIDWGDGLYFLRIRMDATGGTNFLTMGTTQLMSVPYAIYSETTGDTSRWQKNNGDLYFNNGNVGIGTNNPDPWMKLDVRGNLPDNGAVLNVGNSDNTHSIRFFGGRENDPNPFIQWKGGDPLRFSTDEGGWSEKMRITSDGNIGIGTDVPEESALIDMNSNSKGFLLPRMTSEEIGNIQSPADGLQVYNSDDGKLYVFVISHAEWKEISYGASTLPTASIYEIGTGSSCTNTIINGTYEEGYALTVYEYVTIEVNVTSVGAYTISTDTINGYYFSTSGTFISNGIHNIDLAGSGIPVTAQTDNLTATASNGGGTCTFDITVEPGFICGGIIYDDRDGQSYNTVQLGTQCWMAENLNIGFSLGGGNQTDNSIIEKTCWYYEESNCNTHGGLYQWNEMMQYVTTEGVQGICPHGWYLPTDDQWKVLEGNADTQFGVGDPEWDDFGGRGYDAGKRLKATTGWLENTGTDIFGFSAIPGGVRTTTQGFEGWGTTAQWWTTTEYDTEKVWNRFIGHDNDKVYRQYNVKENFYSVRCLRDNY